MTPIIGPRVNVSGCSRCGEDHDMIQSAAFRRPVGEWTHFAKCPNTLEPILVKFVNVPPESESVEVVVEDV